MQGFIYISRNDGLSIFNISGAPVNALIYNNTIFIGPEGRHRIVEQEEWEGAKEVCVFFYNNIFYNQNSMTEYSFLDKEKVEFDYNIFYGKFSRNMPADTHRLTDHPLLIDPGKGGAGRDSLEGYKLQAGSPAIGFGRIIPGNGGMDFRGNPIPRDTAPDCGAYQYVSGK